MVKTIAFHFRSARVMTKRHDDPATPAPAGTAHVHAQRSLRETDDPLLLHPSQSFAPRCWFDHVRPGGRRAQSRLTILVRTCIGLAVVLGLGWSSAASLTASASEAATTTGEFEGSITGHVTDSEGQPVQGANVWASSTAMTIGGTGSATTDADGLYVISSLAAGDYRVQFAGPTGSNLVSEYHPNTTDYWMAVPVKVSAGASVSGIDASLAAGASITGHVSDDQGHPVQGVNVSASSTAMPGGGFGSATTDADGAYVVSGLAAGDYRVQFSPPFGSSLVGEYHPDTTNYSLAVPVKVFVGATVSEIDASLATGASITGLVTDDAWSAGAGCQRVCQRDRNDRWLPQVGDDRRRRCVFDHRFGRWRLSGAVHRHRWVRTW